MSFRRDDDGPLAAHERRDIVELGAALGVRVTWRDGLWADLAAPTSGQIEALIAAAEWVLEREGPIGSLSRYVDGRRARALESIEPRPEAPSRDAIQRSTGKGRRPVPVYVDDLSLHRLRKLLERHGKLPPDPERA